MTAQIGVIGLGVMGENLALNMLDQGFAVAVWDREQDVVERFGRDREGGSQLSATHSLESFVKNLERPRRILMMIKAGPPVDEMIGRLRPLLEPGDILIDGGNSNFRDTERRQTELRGTKLHFVGCGVSGGSDGARHGASLMPGGDPAAWQELSRFLEGIAARSEFGPCVTWVGPGGAGHFVKMVHNGIEYADMQGIAEAYDVLRRLGHLDAPAIADVFAEWNRGPLDSFLVEVTADILRVRDEETGRPLVDLILDKAGQKGTGRWAAQVAIELGVATPALSAAVDARVLSSQKKARVAAAGILPGPDPADYGVTPDERSHLVDDVRDALLGSRICAYAQGFTLISAASAEWDWGVDLREIARVWTAGCIIRARLLSVAMNAFGRNPALPSLLVDAELVKMLASVQEGWRRTLRRGQSAGLPLPAMSASLAYYDMARSPSLPHNLIQAQRDYFGAHTYERTDRPGLGPVHTKWK